MQLWQTRRMKKLLWTFVLLTVSFVLAGELQQLHRAQQPSEQGSPASEPAEGPVPGVKPMPGTMPQAPARVQHDITEIGLERTRCFAGCPAYTVIISADGSFRYTGEYGVERVGEYTGTVSEGRLRQVLDFIAEANFEGFQTSYLSPFLDGPTVYTLVREGDEGKVVENYANNGPATLWAIEQLIDSLLETAEWQPVSDER